MTATRLFDRAVVRVSPLDPSEDVSAFLQGLLTNDLAGPLPAYAALLSAQGKTMFDLIVWPGGEGEILLDCEAAHAEELVKRLSLYRLRRKIDIRVDETVGVHWRKYLGDGAAPDPRLADLGERWLAPASGDDAAADGEWRAHRLALGVPEGRDELGDVLWLETNAVELHGVSFSKGCYVGQENTARMNWRQKVNRRLMVVPLDKSEEKRRKAAYPTLGLAVDHLRLDAIDPASAPGWLAGSLSRVE
ncbi:CAF17-like 4Fe-4S cluster assembly/insertion protein YgfZ [Pelagerythrobacter aerophilus]|uniref:Folate-binding protein n=1 Tax=Pelagerythrobacter aerophilus TaxID=2306995 RepID=A0A418NKE5_9SPHN|nr:folate-binding protein YgfZ [Pelagerythrobacter aerophilus]RIV79649.1 folate-binding protein [Pelagerythrobacter aerophilus]